MNLSTDIVGQLLKKHYVRAVINFAAESHFDKANDYWAQQLERRIDWNDPIIGIQWPIKVKPSVYSQDQQAKALAEAEHFDD